MSKFQTKIVVVTALFSVFFLVCTGSARESRVTGGYPVRTAEDNLRDIVFYSTYGNEQTEINKEEKTIRFKHVHPDGSKSFKQFRVDIKIPEKHILEYHIIPDDIKGTGEVDTAVAEDVNAARVYSKNPKLDLERAYKRFMNFLPPHDFYGAEKRGAHLKAFKEKIRFTESLTDNVITKIEIFEIIETDDGGLIYRIETTIPDKPLGREYLPPESQEIDAHYKNRIPDEMKLELLQMNLLIQQSVEEMQEGMPMAYTAGEEDVFASCQWTGGNIGAEMGISGTFVLTVLGNVATKPFNVNHVYLTDVTSTSFIALYIPRRDSDVVHFGYINLTNDLSLLEEDQTVEIRTTSKFLRYQSKYNVERTLSLQAQSKTEVRDRKKFPDGYSNRITVDVDLNIAIISEWRRPISDEIIIYNVAKTLGVKEDACPAVSGYEITFEIDNYYTPIVGPHTDS